MWVETGSFDIIIAYEKSVKSPQGNGIRLRHYENLEELKRGRFKDQMDLPNALTDVCCEGTPSFESVESWTGDLKTSKFTLRFHYLDGSRDQQALGHYDGSWRSPYRISLKNFFSESVPNFIRSVF